MRITKRFICPALLCIVFLTCLSPSAKAFLLLPQKGDSVELTQTDIARQKSFNGNHATLFGIALGMGKSRVLEILANYPNLTMAKDPFNPRRFYLQDITNDTTKTNIAYLKWLNYDSGLYQIILYPPVSKYLRGLSTAIVSESSVDPESEIYKSFLGAPTGRQVTLDMPNIKAKTTILYYPKYNIAIEEAKTAQGTEYRVILTHKL